MVMQKVLRQVWRIMEVVSFMPLLGTVSLLNVILTIGGEELMDVNCMIRKSVTIQQMDVVEV